VSSTALSDDIFISVSSDTTTYNYMNFNTAFVTSKYYMQKNISTSESVGFNLTHDGYATLRDARSAAAPHFWGLVALDDGHY